MRKLAALVLGWSLATMGFAQSDTLWTQWKDSRLPDTVRLKAIQTLAWKTVFDLPDSGVSLASEQLKLALASGNEEARYGAYTTMAVGSSIQGDLKTALGYLQQSLSVARTMGDRKREANTLSNMSNVYRSLGDLPLALEHLHQSLRIDTGLGDREGLAGTYNNIGNIHTELGDLPKALENYERSAKLYAQLDLTKGKAQALMNLGATHLEMGQPVQALDEFLQSLALYRSMGRRMESGMAFNNLGRTYGELGRQQEAFTALDSAYRDLVAVGSQRQIARNHYYRGLLLLDAGQAPQAVTECNKGLAIARLSALPLQRKECCECLMKAYEAQGDLARAFRAQKEYMQLGDSLDALNNGKEVLRLDLQRQFQEQQITDSLKTVRARYEQELAYQEQLGKERARRNAVLFGGAGLLALALGLWNQLRFVRRSRAAIQRERQRSDDLLHNILPAEVAAELKARGSAQARHFDQVTILFTDLQGFTQVSEQLSPAALVDELNECFKAFDAIMGRHGVEKIKTIGDAYMAAGGIPTALPNAPRSTLLAALEMQAFMRRRHEDRTARGLPAFAMRAGLHTGPVVAGIVGTRKFQYDIWGDAVNTASRMESAGEVGRVNISDATYALLRDDPAFRFIPRGRIPAKGKGELEMYFAENA